MLGMLGCCNLALSVPGLMNACSWGFWLLFGSQHLLRSHLLSILKGRIGLILEGSALGQELPQLVQAQGCGWAVADGK